MRKWVAGFVLIPFLFALSRVALAFVDAPVLVPPNPMAGQLVSVSVNSGVCDTFSTYPPPTVTRTGSNIRIILPGVFTVDPFCIFPIGPSVFPVGAFGEGSYSLQVDRTYLDNNGRVTETLGIIPFGVATVAPVPMFNLIGMIGLILIVLIASTMNIAGIRSTEIRRSRADVAGKGQT